MRWVSVFILFFALELKGECGENDDFVFLQLNKSSQNIQKLNQEIDTSLAGSDKRLFLILKKDHIIKEIQESLYQEVLQGKISSEDPRAGDKLIIVKRLLEITTQMKDSLDKGLLSDFDSELSSLKLLLKPEEVCPKKEKNPRRYKIKKYL